MTSKTTLSEETVSMESKQDIVGVESFEDLIKDTNRYNEKILEIMNNRWIIKVILKDDSDGMVMHRGAPKYMLIRNELLLTDSFNYTLQGEDIWYLYGEYGEFGNGKQLDSNEYNMYSSRFHSSGRVVFSDWISDLVIYKTEEDIMKIEDEDDRNMILRLHRDIRRHNWLPKNQYGI